MVDKKLFIALDKNGSSHSRAGLRHSNAQKLLLLFAVVLIKEELGFQYLQSGTFHKNEQNKPGTKDMAY